MTAFARAGSNHLSWEIRSVNQRYLDVTFRVPDNLRGAEPEFRNILRAEIHRGKVDCILRLDPTAGEAGEPIVDQVQLERVTRLIDHLAAGTGNLAPVNPLELLRWPGVLIEATGEQESLIEQVKTYFEQAMRGFVQNRQREGAELERVISERLDEFETMVRSIREIAPGINARLAERLKARLDELKSELDTGRLEQELVYLAQKSDIQEELDRLDTHIAEVRGAFQEDGSIGRKLDFLMQELNREANTLSSKSVAAETSIRAVELKVLIEQMREQVQNIE
jgi:uncharacterized protein (TIGR00255 family)